MGKLQGFVDLDRRFSELDTSGELGTDAASQSYLAGYPVTSGDRDWGKLLQENLVIVLGEPGSGKSWEFRNRCGVIRDRGDYAFFVELERLTAATFAEAVDSEDLARFRSWQKSVRPAWFFLDSVDEAKIRRQSDFYAALSRMRDATGPSAQTARDSSSAPALANGNPGLTAMRSCCGSGAPFRSL